MKRLAINIVKTEPGYVCIASNGDLPFEGRVHATRTEAMEHLWAAYRDHEVWHTRETRRGVSIQVD